MIKEDLDDVASTVPDWWSPGLPVKNTVRVMEETLAGAAAASSQDMAVLVDDSAEVEVQEGESVKKKRKVPVHVPKEMRAWFLEYAEMQSRCAGWSKSQTLRSARLMKEKMFGSINVDTIYKWKRRGPNDEAEKRGSGSKFDEATVVLLGHTFGQMVAKIQMSAPMLKIIGDQTLKEIGATSTISV
eukprot:764377-Amphidinium_carterae.1